MKCGKLCILESIREGSSPRSFDGYKPGRLRSLSESHNKSVVAGTRIKCKWPSWFLWHYWAGFCFVFNGIWQLKRKRRWADRRERESYCIWKRYLDRKPQTWTSWAIELIRRGEPSFHTNPFLIPTVWITLLKTGLPRPFLYLKICSVSLSPNRIKSRFFGKAYREGPSQMSLPCL